MRKFQRLLFVLKHCHNNRKDSLQRRAVLIEILFHVVSCVMLELNKRPKTPGISLEKTWLSLKGISYLQVIFMLF